MIGEKIRSLRKRKGLSQRKLADLLGVSPSAIAMYETDKRTPDNELLGKIADFFGVTIPFLLGRDKDIIIINDKELHLHEEVALKLATSLHDDGYKITNEDLPDLIMAAKIALSQKKNQKN